MRKEGMSSAVTGSDMVTRLWPGSCRCRPTWTMRPLLMICSGQGKAGLVGGHLATKVPETGGSWLAEAKHAHQVGEVPDGVTDGVGRALEVEVHGEVVTGLQLGGPHSQVEEVAGRSLAAVGFGRHLPRGLALGRQPLLVRPHLPHRGRGGSWSWGRGVELGRGQHGGRGCPGLPELCCPGLWPVVSLSMVTLMVSAILGIGHSSQLNRLGPPDTGVPGPRLPSPLLSP